MTVWTSFLWKINIQLAEKWPEMVIKWAFVIVIRFDSEYKWPIWLSLMMLRRHSKTVIFFSLADIFSSSFECRRSFLHMHYPPTEIVSLFLLCTSDTPPFNHVLPYAKCKNNCEIMCSLMKLQKVEVYIFWEVYKNLKKYILWTW